MKKSLKKGLALLLVMAFSTSMFAACGKSTGDKATDADVKTPATEAPTEAATEAVTPEAESEPVIDLGGIEIIVGDWWSSEDPAEPKNAQEEATLEYRNMIQEKYNFKIKQVSVGGWDSLLSNFTTSTMAEDPVAHVFIFAQGWVGQAQKNGLLYDLSTLENLDFSDSKWNQIVKDQTTYGEGIYGMANGKPALKMGMFYNKRLFEDAGLGRDLPYDLQASGDWTWERFQEICQKLTIDNNNDGTIDTYAMASSSYDLFASTILSNDARYIGRDQNGKLYNATTEPNFLEAAQFTVDLIQKGYEMPTPESANWDWYAQAFVDGKVAMRFAEIWNVGSMKDMADDYGFVLPPKGPKSADYAVFYNDNVAVIPSCYDAETAEKIAFAYDLWTNPTPGYEGDENSWKDSYYPQFRDERAVDETCAMMYDQAVVNQDYSNFVYGLNQGNFIWDTYALGKTPAEKIEEVSGLWESLINDANK